MLVFNELLALKSNLCKTLELLQRALGHLHSFHFYYLSCSPLLLSLIGPVLLATHSNFWHQNPLKPRQSRNRLVDSNCSSEDGSEREAGRWHLQAQAQARQISFIAINNLSGLADWIAPLALHRSAFTWESRLNIYCFLTYYVGMSAWQTVHWRLDSSQLCLLQGLENNVVWLCRSEIPRHDGHFIFTLFSQSELHGYSLF